MMHKNKIFSERLFPIGLVFLIDVLLTAFSFVLSYKLCTLILPEIDSHRMLIQLPIVVAITSLIFLFIGIYKGVVKYDRLREVYSIFNAICLSNILTIVLVVINGQLVMEQDLMVPLSIIIGHSILSFSALVASRFLYKNIILKLRKNYEKYTNVALVHNIKDKEQINVIINDLLEIGKKVEFNLYVDKKNNDLKSESELPEGIEISEVLIYSLSENIETKWQLMNTSVEYDLPIYKVIGGLATRSSLLKIEKVKLDDLFPSEFKLTKYYNAIVKAHEGKTILITGAGGCIGSQYAKNIYELGIKAKIILLDNSESALNEISTFMKNSKSLTIINRLTDVKDKKAVQKIFSELKPSIVVHAAGNNTPEMLDDNINKVVQENVLASKMLADISKIHKVEKFIFCSAMAADLPSTTIEVSKKLTELYLYSLNESTKNPNFISLRLNKVFDTNSSAVNYFRTQIKHKSSISFNFVKKQEVFTNKKDVANTIAYLISKNLNSNGVYMSNLGVKVQMEKILKFLFTSESIDNDYKNLKKVKYFNDSKEIETSSSVNEKRINILEPVIVKKLENININKEEIQQRIEGLCLNILFDNEDKEAVFSLINDFGSGQWKNLHKLHVDKKQNKKIIKLQSN